MSLQDQKKWDAKYIKKSELLRPRDASAVLMRYAFAGEGLSALDLACGAGRNTIYLAQERYEVDAVDIAEIALDALRVDASQRGLAEYISPILKDLDDYIPSKEAYDIIVMSNFLDRALLERTKEGLKRGGLYIVETYMDDLINEKQDSNVDNLLKKGELKSIFADGYEVIHYDEFENEAHELYRMQKQVIVVQKK